MSRCKILLREKTTGRQAPVSWCLASLNQITEVHGLPGRSQPSCILSLKYERGFQPQSQPLAHSERYIGCIHPIELGKCPSNLSGIWGLSGNLSWLSNENHNFYFTYLWDLFRAKYTQYFERCQRQASHFLHGLGLRLLLPSHFCFSLC